MSKEAVSEVIANALANPAFREKLVANPDEAIKSLRVELTPEEHKVIASLKVTDWEKMRLHEIDARIKGFLLDTRVVCSG
jgi:hypothetical protein